MDQQRLSAYPLDTDCDQAKIYTASPHRVYHVEHPEDKSCLENFDERFKTFAVSSLAVGPTSTATHRPFIRLPPPCVFLPFLTRRDPDQGMLAVETIKEQFRKAANCAHSIPQGLCSTGKNSQWRVQTNESTYRVIDKSSTAWDAEDEYYEEDEQEDPIIIQHRLEKAPLLPPKAEGPQVNPKVTPRYLVSSDRPPANPVKPRQQEAPQQSSQLRPNSRPPRKYLVQLAGESPKNYYPNGQDTEIKTSPKTQTPSSPKHLRSSNQVSISINNQKKVSPSSESNSPAERKPQNLQPQTFLINVPSEKQTPEEAFQSYLVTPINVPTTQHKSNRQAGIHSKRQQGHENHRGCLNRRRNIAFMPRKWEVFPL